MTASDATRIASLHQIFDEPLTKQQKDIALMYAIGLTIDAIGDAKGIKSCTVRKHLDEVRNMFGGITLSTLRSIIFLRVLFNLQGINSPYNFYN
ncbi:TPA: DNA-binding response regulator [Salmonella enterica]|nr:DNA-binding response regulator [Salmonella enterica]HAK8361159.1 DNA-binding response regulator [Salmonella enterica]HAK8660777.1 DNA-binding response regulator [Salmonella enterica]